MKKINLFNLQLHNKHNPFSFCKKHFAMTIDDDPEKMELRFKDKQDRNPIDELKKKEKGKSFLKSIFRGTRKSSKTSTRNSKEKKRRE